MTDTGEGMTNHIDLHPTIRTVIRQVLLWQPLIDMSCLRLCTTIETYGADRYLISVTLN